MTYELIESSYRMSKYLTSGKFFSEKFNLSNIEYEFETIRWYFDYFYIVSLEWSWWENSSLLKNDVFSWVMYYEKGYFGAIKKWGILAQIPPSSNPI